MQLPGAAERDHRRAVEGSRGAAVPAFHFHTTAEPDEVGCCVDVLCGHSLTVASAERFVNSPALTNTSKIVVVAVRILY